MQTEKKRIDYCAKDFLVESVAGALPAHAYCDNQGGVIWHQGTF